MNEILLYKTDNAEVKVEILLQNENLWLTQAKMADLLMCKKPPFPNTSRISLQKASCKNL